MHGPYRLIAPTYVGPLTYRDDPAPAFPVGVVSEDREVVQRSPLYRPPAWMPQGYGLETLKTGDTGSEDALGALYTGPGEPVSITWLRRYTHPIDVILPNPDSVLVFEAVTVDGNPGILWYPEPGSLRASGLTTSLSFMEGDVEITVMGENLDPEAAKGIALSVACGAACAPHEPNGPGIGDVPQAQSAGTAPSPGGSGGGGLTDVTPTEYRIMAGLATASDIVNVSYYSSQEPYWHGFVDPDYDEAALDLTDPAGNTDQRWAYFLSYQFSGTAWLTASTQDYHTYPGNPSGSHCSGRYVSLRVYGGLDDDVGRLTYVHLSNQRDPGDAWAINGSQLGWTVRTLGQPATTQEAGCHFHGTHLHQGMTTASPKLWYNTALPDGYAQINPVSDYTNNWMFKAVLTGDSDGDGCSDQEELGSNPALGGQRDPQNRWDFYDVPVPSLYQSGGAGVRDKAIGMTTDMVALLTYVGSKNTGSDARYNVDLDGDGVQDGIDYDRRPSAYPSQLWRSGPPDGAIGITTDVVAMTKQAGHSCTAPP
jgi:hypothetical protein